MPDPGAAGPGALGPQRDPLRIEAATAEDFAALMREILRRAGITPGQVAAKAHLPRSTVYNWARPSNTRLPRSPEQVGVFCRACRLDTSETEQVLQLWSRLAATVTSARGQQLSASEEELVGVFTTFMRQILKDSGLTGGQVAARSGLPRSTVYNFVSARNTSLPRNAEHIKRFAYACKLSSEETEAVLLTWRTLRDQQDAARRPTTMSYEADSVPALIPEPPTDPFEREPLAVSKVSVPPTHSRRTAAIALFALVITLASIVIAAKTGTFRDNGAPIETSSVGTHTPTASPRATDPPRGPRAYNLANTRSAVWNNGFDVVSEARIGAQRFPASIIGSYQSSATDQNNKATWALARACTQLDVAIGKNADSVSSTGTGRFVILGDGRELINEEVTAADPPRLIRVDISGVMRLTLLDTRQLSDATNVWGTPSVYCQSNPGPRR
ncbi:NPCBM/NEW2 domain-containing protein [Streptomyces lydicus]